MVMAKVLSAGQCQATSLDQTPAVQHTPTERTRVHVWSRRKPSIKCGYVCGGEREWGNKTQSDRSCFRGIVQAVHFGTEHGLQLSEAPSHQ